MQGASLEELRDLSRRSRRTLAWGTVGLTACLLALPATFYVADAWPSLAAWAAGLAVLLGGAMLLKFAHVAGQERGAYRLLFRQAKQRALARTLTPDAPPAAAPGSVHAPR